MPAAVAWLLALVWFLFWSVFVRVAWRAMVAARRSRSWPSTRGHITGATINKKVRPGPDAKGARHEFRLQLRYAYEVNGERYTGTSLRASELGGSEHWDSKANTEALAAAHPIGAERPVFYDPASPDRGTLRVLPERNYWAFVLLFCCIASLSVGILAMGLGPLSPAAKARKQILLSQPAVMDHLDLNPELGVAESLIGHYGRQTRMGFRTFVQVGTNRADYEFVLADGRVIAVQPWRKPGEPRWWRSLMRFLT